MTYTNINLNDITEEHLSGNWEIHEKTINKTAADNLFIQQKAIELLPKGIFKSINGKTLFGTWSITRQHEIIYNPQVTFYLHQQEVGYAIITRLINTIEDGLNVKKLTLYFNTGLEMILKKT